MLFEHTRSPQTSCLRPAGPFKYTNLYHSVAKLNQPYTTIEAAEIPAQTLVLVQSFSIRAGSMTDKPVKQTAMMKRINMSHSAMMNEADLRGGEGRRFLWVEEIRVDCERDVLTRETEAIQNSLLFLAAWQPISQFACSDSLSSLMFLGLCFASTLSSDNTSLHSIVQSAQRCPTSSIMSSLHSTQAAHRNKLATPVPKRHSRIHRTWRRNFW